MLTGIGGGMTRDVLAGYTPFVLRSALYAVAALAGGATVSTGYAVGLPSALHDVTGRRRLSPHQPRRRRDCLGELVQIDGSAHAWFEDRGPPRTLLGLVDDATSRLMQLRFVTSESAMDYFRTTRAYLEEHGKPVAFYSNKRASSGSTAGMLPAARV
jgi:hypothetical protein